MLGAGARGASHPLTETPALGWPVPHQGSLGDSPIWGAVPWPASGWLAVHGAQPDVPLSALRRPSRSRQEARPCLTGLSPGRGCWASSGL